MTWNIERDLNATNCILRSLVIFAANLTLSRTCSMDLHPERRILQFNYILPDLLLIGRNILLALAKSMLWK